MSASQPTPTQSVQAVLDDAGLTWRHWLYFALIALILLTDGMDVTIVSHVFPSLIAEWGVTVAGGIAFVVTASAIAMGIGALIAGRLADRFGRRTMLAIGAVLFSSATALGATSGDFTAFTAWRLIASLGMGAVMPIGMTLLADLVPAKRRAAMVAAAYAAVGLGTTVGATFAGVLIPTGGWRALLAVAGLLPLAVAIVLFLVVPESPAYYIARGAAQKARRVLSHVAPGADLASVDTTRMAGAGFKKEALAVILTKPFTVTTLLLWVFGFLSLGTQLMIVQYLPTLLQQPVPGLSTVQSSTIVAAYGLGSVVSGLVLSALLVKLPRFATIGATLAISAVVALIVGLQTNPGFGALFVLLTVAGFFLPMAFGPTRNILATAAYPARVRGTGVGSTEFAARIGTAVQGAAGGALIGAGVGLSGIFLIVLIPIALLGASLVGLKAAAHRQGADGRTGYSEAADVTTTAEAPA